MPRFPLLLLLLATACTPTAGEWPSLARRPGELARASPCDDPPATVAEPTPGAEPSAPAAAVVDFTDARLRLAAARVAWQRALALTETAVAAAGAAGTTDWATAELSLSRLERYGAEFREIADALGKVMTSPERNALILEATAAYDEHVARFNALRVRLAR